MAVDVEHDIAPGLSGPDRPRRRGETARILEEAHPAVHRGHGSNPGGRVVRREAVDHEDLHLGPLDLLRPEVLQDPLDVGRLVADREHDGQAGPEAGGGQGLRHRGRSVATHFRRTEIGVAAPPPYRPNGGIVLARPLWLLLARRRYPGWRELLGRIRATRALDAPTLAARQEAALTAHLAWARSTIPYWRERAPTGAGPLAAWPVLARSEVQAHEEALRDPTRPVESLRRETSGGSTGTPVAVWQDDAYHTWDFATEAHVLETWGIEPWAPSAFLWGADRDLSDLPRRERLYIRLLRRELVNAFRMGEPELRDAQARLERLQPVYLQGYASALELFARWLQAHAPDHGIRPRAIRSSAETLRPEARALDPGDLPGQRLRLLRIPREREHRRGMPGRFACTCRRTHAWWNWSTTRVGRWVRARRAACWSRT